MSFKPYSSAIWWLFFWNVYFRRSGNLFFNHKQCLITMWISKCPQCLRIRSAVEVGLLPSRFSCRCRNAPSVIVISSTSTLSFPEAVKLEVWRTYIAQSAVIAILWVWLDLPEPSTAFMHLLPVSYILSDLFCQGRQDSEFPVECLLQHAICIKCTLKTPISLERGICGASQGQCCMSSRKLHFVSFPVVRLSRYTKLLFLTNTSAS